MSDDARDTAGGSGDDAVGWRGIIYGVPVWSAEGRAVGTVREVLGSDAEDIFHGIRVRLTADRRDVMVAADDVTSMTRGHLETDLSLDELRALPVYREEQTYHLASVGWLRKHLGWRADSKSDEEAG